MWRGVMEIVVYDIPTETIIYKIPTTSLDIYRLTPLPNPPPSEFHFLAAHGDGTLTTYTIPFPPSPSSSPSTTPTPHLVQNFKPHRHMPHLALLYPSLPLVGTCSSDGKYCVSNFLTGELIWEIQMRNSDAWKCSRVRQRGERAVYAHCLLPGQDEEGVGLWLGARKGWFGYGIFVVARKSITSAPSPT